MMRETPQAWKLVTRARENTRHDDEDEKRRCGIDPGGPGAGEAPPVHIREPWEHGTAERGLATLTRSRQRHRRELAGGLPQPRGQVGFPSSVSQIAVPERIVCRNCIELRSRRLTHRAASHGHNWSHSGHSIASERIAVYGAQSCLVVFDGVVVCHACGHFVVGNSSPVSHRSATPKRFSNIRASISICQLS